MLAFIMLAGEPCGPGPWSRHRPSVSFLDHWHRSVAAGLLHDPPALIHRRWLLVKLTNLHKNFSIYSWINIDYKYLKVVHLSATYSLLLMMHLFVVVRDVRWWWELALKISTWSNLRQKIRIMEQSHCLNVSQQKLESWWTERADKKHGQATLGRPRIVRTVPVLSMFWSALPLGGKQFKQSLCSIFLIFW